ncbi:MAG: SCP2 sterol-binding domain-containing protein [Pyrobaculum sp.]
MFVPTNEWASSLCERVSYDEVEGVLVIKAVDAPFEVSPSGLVTLLLEFKNGKCVRPVLSYDEQDGDYVIEGAYIEFLKILEGKMPAFAAFALGKIRLVKGPLSRLADYMPLALELVKTAREAAKYV